MTPATTKAAQAAYYDHEVENLEFEINRPHGESRLYRYLMGFKFAKLTALLAAKLGGADVLVVCCGSGMDAEYVVHAGGKVVALDISFGCLSRARTRAERYGLDYALIRADAENLPFPAETFSLGISMNALDCVYAPRELLVSLATILKDHGKAVIANKDAGHRFAFDPE